MLIQTDDGRESFHAYLSTVQAQENLEFWFAVWFSARVVLQHVLKLAQQVAISRLNRLQVARYKTLEEGELLEECKVIYDTFKDILNVEATVKNPIEQALRGTFTPPLQSTISVSAFL